MRTLIVPCLGRIIVNSIPQYLNRHPSGKLLIERSIEGIYSESYDKVLIVLLKSDAEQYNADSIIKKELTQYPIDVITLEVMTSGPAETVYQAIDIAGITGPIAVKDADNYLKTKDAPLSNFVAGLNLNTWNRDIHNLRDKSFLIVNEQGNILDIIEKQVRSDVICLGLYGFKKAEDFMMAYEHLTDGTYPISKLYLSHIISYLIGYSNRVFRYVESLDYENWGDERHWKELQRDRALFFIDLDSVLGNSGVLSPEIRDKLLILQERGASFIGYTVKNEECKELTLKALQEDGLRFLKMIYGCPYSEHKEIIVSESDLEKKIIEL